MTHAMILAPGGAALSLHCSMHKTNKLALGNALVGRITRTLPSLSVVCQAKSKAGGILRNAMQQSGQGSSQLALLAAGNYLRGLGVESNIDVTRVLDVCTNPNSIFGSKGGRQPVNPYARKLAVEEMQAVVAFLEGSGFGREDIVKLVLAFPQVLCYSVEARLAPMFACLTSEIGLTQEQVVSLVARRPLLLGLAEDNLRRIVGYLATQQGAGREEIVELLERSL